MSERFVPVKRTALDGVVWWVVYDNEEHCYSRFLCHGKYRTKKAALISIKYYAEQGWYRNELTSQKF